MRNFFKKIHLWLSLPAGIIITIVCLTGSILVFENEIFELCYPERYYAEEAEGKPLSLEKLIPIVNSQLDTCSIAGVKIFSDPKRTYAMSLDKGFRVTAFVNQYTGKVTGIYSFRDSPFYPVMSLHRWLMDGTRTWGKYTVGISTILFVIILLTGIFTWIPRNRKKWKNKLTVKLRSGKKRFFYDLHTVVSIYACILLLLCSLTGLMWSFEWYRNGVMKLFGADTTKQEGGHHSKRGVRGENSDKMKLNVLHWETAIKSLKTDNEYVNIQAGSMTVLQKSAPHLRATDKYTFDNKSGEITKAVLYSDLEAPSKVMGWAYVLHTGAYGGFVMKLVTCIASLIGASLPLTGYYIFYRKRRKKKRKLQAT